MYCNYNFIKFSPYIDDYNSIKIIKYMYIIKPLKLNLAVIFTAAI